ncbi:MAG TPA: DUF6159 family protein, partial [Solirubrobacteraceae bacterium]
QPLYTQTSPGEGRIARSWRLTKAAWSVVRRDRTLLMLACIAAAAGVAGMGLIFAAGGLFDGSGNSSGQVLIAAVVFAYPLTFVSVFLNTAIAAAAAAALDGRGLTVGQALAVPTRRIGQVAVWALIAAGVGFVLEQLASRLPLGGSIVARLVGLAWSLATLFAVPILALEDCSAPECLKRSARVVKDRWGEGVSGSVIITGWVVLAVLPLGVLFAVAIVAASGAPAVQVALIAVAVLVLIAVFAVQAVVRQTFAVALYRFATTGAGQGPFAEDDMQSPFAPKRGSR